MRFLLIAAVVLISLLTVAGVAQIVDGLDLEAVRRRAAAHQADAQAFVNQVKDRGDAFRKEAETVRRSALADLRQAAAAEPPGGPPGAVDFDAIVAGAAANVMAQRGQAPQLIVFASLSMPAASLRPLIADTTRAGGVVVFRGFPDNAMRRFTTALGRVIERQEQFAHVGIDPRLFRAFDVRMVPSFVVVSTDFDLCDGFDCRTAVPPHDRITGNVTLSYALDAFAAGDGPGAAVAALAIQRLRHERP